jgi:hypothetical protein
MRYIREYKEFNNWNVIKKVNGFYPPAFGNESGNTIFFQVVSDDEIISEAEVDLYTPEIVSIKSMKSSKGSGRYLVNYILDILKNDGFDSVKVLATKGSRTFWVKMGAIQEGSDRYKMIIKLCQ